MIDECEVHGNILPCHICEWEDVPEKTYDWEDVTYSGSPQARSVGFVAAFDSSCPECPEVIHAGDRAFMRAGRAVCEECAEEWGDR